MNTFPGAEAGIDVNSSPDLSQDPLRLRDRKTERRPRRLSWSASARPAGAQERNGSQRSSLGRRHLAGSAWIFSHICFSSTERCLEDHELVVQVESTMASESKFLFRKNYAKYEFFKNPTVRVLTSLGSGFRTLELLGLMFGIRRAADTGSETDTGVAEGWRTRSAVSRDVLTRNSVSDA